MPMGHSKSELDQLEQQIHDAAPKVSKKALAELLKRLWSHYQAQAEQEEKPGIPPDT